MTILGISISDWILIGGAAFGVVYWFIKLERSVDTLKTSLGTCQKDRKECLLQRERQHSELRGHADQNHDKVVQMLMEIQRHLGMLNGRTDHEP